VPLSIEVDLSERVARVSRGGRVVKRFRVGIGRPGSPTPTGRFAITDRLISAPNLPYGCCVLALSGRQPNLPSGWGGGNRLALHGVADESRVGKATSFGCLHVRERDLKPLLVRVRNGTRVDIEP
jgi:lipoprotein-anchoring transpeptidase ErfK/SrfK